MPWKKDEPGSNFYSDYNDPESWESLEDYVTDLALNPIPKGPPSLPLEGQLRNPTVKEPWLEHCPICAETTNVVVLSEKAVYGSEYRCQKFWGKDHEQYRSALMARNKKESTSSSGALVPAGQPGLYVVKDYDRSTTATNASCPTCSGKLDDKGFCTRYPQEHAMQCRIRLNKLKGSCTICGHDLDTIGYCSLHPSHTQIGRDAGKQELCATCGGIVWQSKCRNFWNAEHTAARAKISPKADATANEPWRNTCPVCNENTNQMNLDQEGVYGIQYRCQNFSMSTHFNYREKLVKEQKARLKSTLGSKKGSADSDTVKEETLPNQKPKEEYHHSIAPFIENVGKSISKLLRPKRHSVNGQVPETKPDTALAGAALAGTDLGPFAKKAQVDENISESFKRAGLTDDDSFYTETVMNDTDDNIGNKKPIASALGSEWDGVKSIDSDWEDQSSAYNKKSTPATSSSTPTSTGSWRDSNWKSNTSTYVGSSSSYAGSSYTYDSKPKTSEDHPIRVDQLRFAWLDGVVGRTICPGKVNLYGSRNGPWKRNLDLDLQRIRQDYNVDILVGLMEAKELHDVEVPLIFDKCQRYGLQYIWYPIVDSSLPKDMPSYVRFIEKLAGAVKRGKSVTVHCLGGIGRTGTVNSSIFQALGYSADESLVMARKLHSKACENSEQEKFVLKTFPLIWKYHRRSFRRDPKRDLSRTEDILPRSMDLDPGELVNPIVEEEYPSAPVTPSASSSPTTSSPKPLETKTFSRILGRGDTGAEVRDLQVLLETLGFQEVLEDPEGAFQQHTEDALKQFQKEQALHVDGRAAQGDFNRLQLEVAKYKKLAEERRIVTSGASPSSSTPTEVPAATTSSVSIKAEDHPPALLPSEADSFKDEGSTSQTVSLKHRGIVRYGDTGPGVIQIQKALEFAGYTLGNEIKGRYGVMTEKAIKELQKKNNFAEDGAIGGREWDVLEELFKQRLDSVKATATSSEWSN